MTEIHVFGCTDPGPVRDHNEDCFSIGPHVVREGSDSVVVSVSAADFREFGLLCAVADGMGGYAGGALAARTALEGLVHSFYSRSREGMTVDELAADLELDLAASQSHLVDVLQHEDREQAGTTLAGIVLLPPDVMVVFHCGDSRVLRASGGYVRALTLDHAPLAAAVASGQLDEVGAASSPLASRVSRSLGVLGESTVEINTDYTWATGDSFLICSDGFHGLGRGLPQATIRDLLSHAPHGELVNPAEWLIEKAVAHDGHDNATLVLVTLGEEAA